MPFPYDLSPAGHSGQDQNSTYRFDITVDERCSATPRTRVLGVMAIAEMSYWDPFYFVV